MKWRFLYEALVKKKNSSNVDEELAGEQAYYAHCMGFSFLGPSLYITILAIELLSSGNSLWYSRHFITPFYPLESESIKHNHFGVWE